MHRPALQDAVSDLDVTWLYSLTLHAGCMSRQHRAHVQGTNVIAGNAPRNSTWAARACDAEFEPRIFACRSIVCVGAYGGYGLAGGRHAARKRCNLLRTEGQGSATQEIVVSE